MLSKCAPNELTISTLYLFFSTIAKVTMNADCPNWWPILDPLLESKMVAEPEYHDPHHIRNYQSNSHTFSCTCNLFQHTNRGKRDL